jgi:hypothetical protein
MALEGLSRVPKRSPEACVSEDHLLHHPEMHLPQSTTVRYSGQRPATSDQRLVPQIHGPRPAKEAKQAQRRLPRHSQSKPSSSSRIIILAFSIHPGNAVTSTDTTSPHPSHLPCFLPSNPRPDSTARARIGVECGVRIFGMGMRPASPLGQVWWRRHHRGSALGSVGEAETAGAAGESKAAGAVEAVEAVVETVGTEEGFSAGAVDRQRGQQQVNAYCDSSSCWRVSHGDETSMYDVRIW